MPKLCLELALLKTICGLDIPIVKGQAVTMSSLMLWHDLMELHQCKIGKIEGRCELPNMRYRIGGPNLTVLKHVNGGKQSFKNSCGVYMVQNLDQTISVPISPTA